MFGTILLVFAFVFFFLGTFFFGPGAPANPWYGRFNFVSAGLAAWVLAELIGRGALLR